MLLYFIHVHKCLYRLPGVLRFIARSGNHIITSLRVDKYGLFKIIFFQTEKGQQMRQAGQRLIEIDCILWRGVWI